MKINNEVQLWLESAQCGNIPLKIIEYAKKISSINCFLNKPSNKNIIESSLVKCNTWHGNRPYLGALEEYNKYICEIVDKMKKKLIESKSFSYIETKIHFNEKISIITDNGETRTYSWDSVHYGPIIPFNKNNRNNTNLEDLQSYRKLKKRDTPWLKLGYTEHPFKSLQKKYENQRFILSDIYDEKNKISRIRLKMI